MRFRRLGRGSRCTLLGQCVPLLRPAYWVLVYAAALGMAGVGCTGGSIADPGSDGDGLEGPGDAGGSTSDAAMDSGLRLEIGIPDSENTTSFLSLEEDGDVLIQDGGQGGTHALIAIRFEGFGNWIFYQVGLTNLDGDGRVETPPLPRARPVPCDGDVCRVSPIFMQLGGLADRSEWDGLHVEISATVNNEDGAEASATRRGILTR